MKFRPKQSLGQNFLIDGNIARNIVDQCDFEGGDTVIEIGPGRGCLTRLVQPLVHKLVAIEIDNRLIQGLEEEFRACDNVEIIHADFLNFSTLPEAQRLRIIGNIPYHITSPILFKVIQWKDRVFDLTLLVQREVADRIVATPRSKQYGILSIFSQTYADVCRLLTVPKTVFTPVPKVESALVRWRFTAERSTGILDDRFFRQIVRQAFGKRRKMLRNSLKDEILRSSHFDVVFQKRPEELDVTEWIELANSLLRDGIAG